MEDEITGGVTIEGIGEKKRFFSGLDMFKGVEKERLMYLSQIATKLSFSPAQTIIRQGEEPDAIYFLSKGNVELYRLPVTSISASEKRLNLHEDTAMSASQHLSAVRLFNTM
jgi:signal-transduction protein with cAMP-binding, CBS, and nucleotidyltransferase domain